MIRRQRRIFESRDGKYRVKSILIEGGKSKHVEGYQPYVISGTFFEEKFNCDKTSDSIVDLLNDVNSFLTKELNFSETQSVECFDDGLVAYEFREALGEDIEDGLKVKYSLFCTANVEIVDDKGHRVDSIYIDDALMLVTF